MSMPAPPPNDPDDGCARLHAEVATRCNEAHAAQAAHEAQVERVRELKRDLVAAQRRQEEAVAAADPRLRAAEKAAARDAYQLARAMADDDAALAEATATWGHAIDRVNRTDRLARRAVSRAQAAAGAIETALREAEREEQLARMRAEQAKAACLDARVRLAACEEGAEDAAGASVAAGARPPAAAGTHALAIGRGDASGPLVIEALVGGDQAAVGLAAAEISEHTDLSAGEAQLQLQELIEAIRSAAAEEGFLVFDGAHPFWGQLSFEESRDVVGALARLGFVFEPTEGWHANRVPTQSDLKVALGYAGLDAFSRRGLPDSEALSQLPWSIGVDARAFLASQAPELSVDQLARVLGRRAEQLEPLWDAWGGVRRVLLSDRHQLGDLPG